MAVSLVKLIKSGDVEMATDLLLTRSWTPTELDSQDEGDGTALFWAACRGYVFLVELLLTFGATVRATSQATDATALHVAADNNRLEIVRLLLKWGANIHARNNYKDSPCHLAAYRGHADIVWTLLNAGSDPWLRNARGFTVMEEAKAGKINSHKGQHMRVQYLLDVYLNQSNPPEQEEDNTSHVQLVPR